MISARPRQVQPVTFLFGWGNQPTPRTAPGQINNPAQAILRGKIARRRMQTDEMNAKRKMLQDRQMKLLDKQMHSMCPHSWLLCGFASLGSSFGRCPVAERGVHLLNTKRIRGLIHKNKVPVDPHAELRSTHDRGLHDYTDVVQRSTGFHQLYCVVILSEHFELVRKPSIFTN